MEGLTVRRTNGLLLVVFLLFATIGSVSQSLNLKLGLLITEWGIILLPTLIFVRRRTGNVRQAMRLNPINIKTALFAVAVGIVGWIVASSLEGVIAYFLTRLGLSTPPQQINIPAGNPIQLIQYFFLVSISAGICEEFLFRGLVLRGYEEWGTLRAVFFSGLLFALMHVSVIKFFPILIIGLIFAYMAAAFNSIYTSMIAHATNNAISVFLIWLTPFFTKVNIIIQALLGLGAIIVFVGGFIAAPFLVGYISRRAKERFIPPSAPLSHNLSQLVRMWTFDVYIFLMLALASLEVLYMLGLLEKIRLFR